MKLYNLLYYEYKNNTMQKEFKTIVIKMLPELGERIEDHW